MWKFIVCLTLVIYFPVQSKIERKSPNILIIVADDLGNYSLLLFIYIFISVVQDLMTFLGTIQR